MAKRRKRGGFGEPPAKHKEAFRAHFSLSNPEKVLDLALREMEQGKCRDALVSLMTAAGDITAMTVHANGFAAGTKALGELREQRDRLYRLQYAFGNICMCKGK
jgi:hypothetical protein